MAVFVQHDVLCNRCDKVYATYGTGNEGQISIIYRHMYLSICPKCTQEVMKAMGYETKEKLKTLHRGIREAETKNNYERNLKEGVLCRVCEKKFGREEVRVRRNDCSNVEAWHLGCYPKPNALQGVKGKGVGGG